MTPHPESPRGARAIRIAGAWVALAALALTACSLSRPSPVKTTFLLEPARPAAAASARPQTIRVGAISVAAPYRGRSFVYRTGELQYETDYYHEFVVAPSAMLAEATARVLGAARSFRRVVPPGVAGSDDDLVLDGFASELYADARDPAKPAAVVGIAFYVSDAGAPQRAIVFAREYQARIALSGTTPADLVRAWNEALSSVLGEFARDLAAAPLTRS